MKRRTGGRGGACVQPACRGGGKGGGGHALGGGGEQGRGGGEAVEASEHASDERVRFKDT
jgi:hypothetical protein